ncbi:hypothetical protein EVAR_43191_1 [Eumeta japonica]|uniref:Mos1 transposase HTH domain-containing protein n=1 Tax=Eumeta variegata TaxID=151549 RepID=A0A4C1WRP9_EUMVA|nr:hypothetical protein EVAR_43191_1 [Eumeta japonica]
MNESNVGIRYILKLYYEKGKSPAQAAKKICDVRRPNAISVRAAQNWFKRFQSGNFDVKEGVKLHTKNAQIVGQTKNGQRTGNRYNQLRRVSRDFYANAARRCAGAGVVSPGGRVRTTLTTFCSCTTLT